MTAEVNGKGGSSVAHAWKQQAAAAFWSPGLAVDLAGSAKTLRHFGEVFDGKMEEPSQSPVNKKKKTTGGVAAAHKDSAKEEDSDTKQQENGEGVNLREAAKTAGKTDVRFNRFKLFDKVMQKSLEKYVEIAR